MRQRQHLRVAPTLAALLVAPLCWAQPAPDADLPLTMAEMQEKLRELEDRLQQTDDMILARQPRITFSGYADIGFFVPFGNDGVGFISDVGAPSARAFPEHAGQYAWVFLGDPLATAVNTRGEVADLGNSPGVDRFDSINSNGAPGFIANEVNLAVRAAVADNALATASINFTPRSGRDFRLGDSFDVDQVQLEWLVGSARRTSLFVGKFDSVIGIEYRERKSHQRFGITPSLLARYTTGTPLGLKVRSKLGPNAYPDLFVVAAALTNGSSGIEAFHFHNEIDTNSGKTASGRLAVLPPLPIATELGVSAEYGAQDHARNNRNRLWFWGVDLRVRLSAFDVKAQWLRGSGEGETPASAAQAVRPYGLRLNDGAYLEVDWLPNARWGGLARAEFRDAAVWLGNPLAVGGAERLYITKVWRGTIGVRFAFTERIVWKGEYLHNAEYGGLPSFQDDVLTSSLVLIY